jgi:hypothetical protein
MQDRQTSSPVAACVLEYESAGHSVHAADPGLDLYDPARHPEHGPPSGPVYPASHTQSVMRALPSRRE